uniref:Uncharacterized protein n=1 Tax=Sphaeramia orbicularis TaxID=375764 RepID=A0A673AKH2_9TELE
MCVSSDAGHPYQVEKRPVTVIFSVWLNSNIVPCSIKAFHFKTGQTAGVSNMWPGGQMQPRNIVKIVLIFLKKLQFFQVIYIFFCLDSL